MGSLNMVLRILNMNPAQGEVVGSFWARKWNGYAFRNNFDVITKWVEYDKMASRKKSLELFAVFAWLLSGSLKRNLDQGWSGGELWDLLCVCVWGVCLVVQGMEPRALCILSMGCTTELHPQLELWGYDSNVSLRHWERWQKGESGGNAQGISCSLAKC